MKIYRILAFVLLMLLFACAAAAEENVDRYAVDGGQFVLMDRDGVRLYLTGAYAERDGQLRLTAVGENSLNHAVSVLFSRGEANGFSLARGGDYLFWMDACSAKEYEFVLDADFIAAVNGAEPGAADAVAHFAGLETLGYSFEVYDDSSFVPEKMFACETGTIHFHATEEQAAGGATVADMNVLAEQKAKDAIGADKYFVRGEPLTLFDEYGMKLYLTGEYYDYDALYLSARFENNTDMRVFLNYFREEDKYNHTTFGSGYAIDPGTVEVGEIVLREPFVEPDMATLVFLAHDADDPKLETVFRMDVGKLYFGTETFSAKSTDVTAPAPAMPVETHHAEEQDAYAQYETLQNGSRGEAVARLQQKLIELGHLSGSADGIYGKGTAAGVSRFQESVGLGATGVADPVTQSILFGE